MESRETLMPAETRAAGSFYVWFPSCVPHAPVNLRGSSTWIVPFAKSRSAIEFAFLPVSLSPPFRKTLSETRRRRTRRARNNSLKSGRERERKGKKDVGIVRFESIVIPRAFHVGPAGVPRRWLRRSIGRLVATERKKKVRLVWKIGCAPAGILFTGERHRYRGQAIYQPIVFGQGERELELHECTNPRILAWIFVRGSKTRARTKGIDR